MTRNRPLTSIRGIAALWVVGYHFTSGFSDAPTVLPRVFELGFAGVDTFFVLSGFILLTVHPALGAADWKSFMTRRLFRVYPLHVTVMILLGLAVLIAGFAHVRLSSDGHYDWMGFLPALLLVKWLDPGLGVWNAPSWSIAAELVCYAMLPVLAPLLARAPRTILWLVAAVLGIAAGAWLVGVLAYYPGHPGDGMLRWPGVVRALLGFAFGTVLASLLRTASAGSAKHATEYAWILEIAACALLVAICVTEFVAAVPAVSGLLVIALALDAGPLARVLRARPLYWLGQVSFGLYLLHEPVISAVGKLPWARLDIAASPLREAIVLAITLAGAALTHRWIEEPGRRLPERLGLLQSRPAFQDGIRKAVPSGS